MWHCFGRSSDLGYVQKQHVSVSADGTFYLRLLRVKTSEEQGLTLIPDKSDFLTCPLHALAVALATQDAPGAALLAQLPDLVTEAAAPLDEGVPLQDLLQAEPASLEVAVVSTTAPVAAGGPPLSSTFVSADPPPSSWTETQTAMASSQTKKRSGEVKRGEDGVQAYVNRMLKRVAEPAGATPDLTSHSFRRGGAQHANGDDRLAAQWIFDRGAWDMTKTNKAFAYITNTAREDRKVARVLSGWAADDVPAMVDVAALDHASRERLGRFQVLLFGSCTGLNQQRLNVSIKVLSVLTAYLIRYYPQLKELSPSAPIVTRVEECLVAAGIPIADMLAWSVALDNEAAPPAQEKHQHEAQHHCSKLDHLLAVIQELTAMNKALTARVTIVEAALMKSKKAPQEIAEEDTTRESSDQEPKPKRRKKQATHLSATWFESYTRVPRVWESADRQKKSESRHVVAFMKLFLDKGFVLEPQASDYKDQVLQLGRRAEDSILSFLKTNVKSNAKGSGSVLRALRPLHKSGALNERIAAHKRLLATGRIQDPAPADTQDILALARQA
ncbi:hypothetical protein PF003_g28657 [Phytophthora fragariae]|nr:hypothetical protein PF003_g28657 [Phytophthora fragariae]